MAADATMGSTKVGLSGEEWLKMWESGFTHDNTQQSDDPEGHHRHHKEDFGHSTIEDVDSHGTKLKVDSYLFRNLNSLTKGDTTEAVLVPLCGSTKDLEWLCSKGYSVAGLEISEKAVKHAFEKACAGPIPYEVCQKGKVKVYSATDGKNLKVHVGNFFSKEISSEEIGTFGCIWDSHGIVSLPVSQQKPYAKKLQTFLKPGGRMMFSMVYYDINKLAKGPAPAPMSRSMLAEHYPSSTVTLLEEEKFEQHEFEGVDHMTNPIILVEDAKQ